MTPCPRERYNWAALDNCRRYPSLSGMNAWLMDDYTGIEKLRLAEAPEPAAGPGEAVLELHFAALNPADRYLAERQYPAKPVLPHILGRDGMGIVTQVGPGVSEARVGERRTLLRGETGINKPGT